MDKSMEVLILGGVFTLFFTGTLFGLLWLERRWDRRNSGKR